MQAKTHFGSNAAVENLQKVLERWHLMVPVVEQNHGDGDSRGEPKWQYWGRSWGTHSASTADTPDRDRKEDNSTGETISLQI